MSNQILDKLVGKQKLVEGLVEGREAGSSEGVKIDQGKGPENPTVIIQVQVPKEVKAPSGFYNPKNKLIVRTCGTAISVVKGFMVIESEEDTKLCEYFTRIGVLEKK